MGKYKLELPANEVSDAHGVHEHEHDHDHDAGNSALDSDTTAKIVTVGAVVVGAAVFEAALIPGVLLGAAAVLAPKVLPNLRDRLQPLFSTTVRGAYKLGRKARAAVGEVREHVSDIAAEVEAEEVSAADEAAAKA